MNSLTKPTQVTTESNQGQSGYTENTLETTQDITEPTQDTTESNLGGLDYTESTAESDQSVTDHTQDTTEPNMEATESDQGDMNSVESTGEPTRDETTPTQDITQPEDTTAPALLTYEEYMSLSGAEQMAYYNSFDNPDDFFNWFNVAKTEYDEKQNKVHADENGNYDLEDMFNNND